MLDTSIRKLIDPALDQIAKKAVGMGVTANGTTWAGFALAMVAAFAIAQQAYWTGLFLLLLSRLCDGLDGMIARQTETTDLGGFLDIVLDFAFYGAIPLAFIFSDPAANALAGSWLLLVFYVNGASFLTYALMAEKRGLAENARGSKSLLYTAGLAEGTETIVVFVLMCLWPAWFSTMAYIFSAVVVITTASRIAMAYGAFRN